MRIAIPYHNGNVIPAFGRAEYFKLYDAENGEIVSTEIIDNGGYEHKGLITHLKNNSVDVALVGNIGQHGADAFRENGIELYTSNFGGADDIVRAYLDGTLELKKEVRGCGYAG